METSKDAVTSDTEGQEKPVRKQLQKASISRASGETSDSTQKDGADMEDESVQRGAAENPESGDKPMPAQDLRKKRSFEEIDDRDPDNRPAARTRSQHTRKRSRDSTAEEDELNNGRKISGERKRDDIDVESTTAPNGEAQAPVSGRPGTPEEKLGKRGEEKVESMTSPKTKRSRLHSTTAEEDLNAVPPLAREVEESTDVGDDAISDPPVAEQTTAKKFVTAKENVAPDVRSPKIPSGSGFANTSATSPFGAVTSPKSSPGEQGQTSASAFAASGFGSLAGTATSGFGALGKTSGGPSGGWGSKKSSSGATSSQAPNGTDNPASTFGGALGQQSGFDAASGGSTFGSSSGSTFGGKLGGGGTFGGSGFGSLGGAAGLSSFASGKPSPFASGSAKPTRPFGAPVDEDEDGEGEDDDGDESGVKSPLSQESDKQDERFYAQDHETGEEGEVTEFSCRAKLYNFAVVDPEKGKKEWKERGLGTVRLNVARPAATAEGGDGDGEPDVEKADAKGKARLVMRADGSHRLILNTPVQKDIKFGAVGGGPPQGGLILFMGAVDGKSSLEMLQLKIRQQFALELYEKIKELQEAM